MEEEKIVKQIRVDINIDLGSGRSALHITPITINDEELVLENFNQLDSNTRDFIIDATLSCFNELILLNRALKESETNEKS